MASTRLLGQAVRLARYDSDQVWPADGTRRFGAIGLFVAVGTWVLAVPAVSAAAEPTSTGGAAEMEVVVTGSSIAQKADTSALPVMVLSEKDIAKTGVASISDLVQSLPAMQGFVPASSSVNGGGVGVTTAALHSLASKYTLVLLDG
jgi:iron complex outermembrane receptor protein